MSDRLESAWQKLDRAKEHIAALDAGVTQFWDASPLEIKKIDSAEPEISRYRVTRIKPLPASIPLIAGDATHNIRSALDHFAWAVVSQPSRTTAFPVWSTEKGQKTPTPAAWTKKVQHDLEGAPSGLIDAVRRLEPWEGGRDSLLWTAHELDRIDKHRLLLSIAVVNTSVQLHGTEGNYAADVMRKFSGLAPNQPLSFEPIEWTPLNEGAVLLNVFEDLLLSDSKTTFEFDVTLGEPAEARGKSAVEHLSTLASFVGQTMTDLTPFI